MRKMKTSTNTSAREFNSTRSSPASMAMRRPMSMHVRLNPWHTNSTKCVQDRSCGWVIIGREGREDGPSAARSMLQHGLESAVPPSRHLGLIKRPLLIVVGALRGASQEVVEEQDTHAFENAGEERVGDGRSLPVP